MKLKTAKVYQHQYICQYAMVVLFKKERSVQQTGSAVGSFENVGEQY